MGNSASTASSITCLQRFLNKKRRARRGRALSAVSLFSGAGISDMGYELAGFRFLVQVEMDPARAAIGSRNFPRSEWVIGDARKVCGKIVCRYRKRRRSPPDLLVATPPCQGMSSSNPSRGKRKTPEAYLNDEKNALVLSVIPVARQLKPKVIVAENVRQVLTHTVGRNDKEAPVLKLLVEGLRDYTLFKTSINVADYGVPQTRHRALIVAVREEEPWVLALEERRRSPWPGPSHADKPVGTQRPRVTIRAWLEAMKYPTLSSASPGGAANGHPLHFVPHYDSDRFRLVSDIPPYSGASAYENDVCPACGAEGVPLQRPSCHACGQPMTNRPIVIEEGGPRLIKGFKSSYRRMRPDEPAPTVTTNSSHIGSDNKIHPWEHRVLSILECADLQTVPRFLDWSAALEANRAYLVRNLIGEAFPSYFTYLHGRALRGLLTGSKRAFVGLAKLSAPEFGGRHTQFF